MSIPLRAWERYRLHPGNKLRLSRMPADATGLCDDKQHARKILKHYRKQIDELTAKLAAENQRALLIVLQGMDASGKDGAVKKVFTGVNPQHQRAYEEAVARTATRQAPWYVLPADHKWYRDVAVAGIVLSALKRMNPRLPHPKLDTEKLAAKL